MNPVIQLDLRFVQGDGTNYIFPVTQALSGTPFNLSQFSAGFSMRQNYGDASALISMTTSAPSPNGSTIAIVNAPGFSTYVSAIQLHTSPADELALPTLMGQRITKFYYNWWIQQAGFDPITMMAGAFYLWTRV